jgi:ferrous iron transport protein A
LEPITADTIETNQTVRIIGLEDGETSLRLGEMGFWPGKEITLVLSAPFGDPLAFEVDNTVIALRKEEAKMIKVLTTTSAA